MLSPRYTVPRALHGAPFTHHTNKSFLCSESIIMKTFVYTIFLLSAVLQHSHGYAQQTADKIEGIWKGTSLCQVKQSACHNESVVYHISKKSATLYTIEANKIVNGVEEDMGVFDAVYDDTKQTLTFTMQDRQGHNDVWLFNIDGMQMHGTLTIDEKTLFRIVELKKN
jgi:hypothetical protein